MKRINIVVLWSLLALVGGLDEVHANGVFASGSTGEDGSFVVLRPPAGRSGHAMAYDSIQNRVMLFGGSVGVPTYFNDTWLWDGANWITNAPANRPEQRESHALASDVTRGRVVLFGGVRVSGQGIGTYFPETWEWDGVNWISNAPANRPSSRTGHAMVYDAARGRVVLFGGSSVVDFSSITYNDTWEWDGVNWTSNAPANRPSARRDHAMAYDAARGRVVLFGGSSGSSLSDTWEWDGVNWTSNAPANRPSARRDHAMAYDAARDRVVLFGGNSGSSLSDTWEWDGVNWVSNAPANRPSARAGHALSYDAARGRVVLFGGLISGGTIIDTWEWDGADWFLPGDRLPFFAARSNGVFQFTEFLIDAGQTQAIPRNAQNAPIQILVQGDARIDGTLTVNGVRTTNRFGAVGGPGGFDGGNGAVRFQTSGNLLGEPGKGPGGGLGGVTSGQAGGAGGYAMAGDPPLGGSPYGNELITPLIGGSGGGGGASRTNSPSIDGGGGGGGGGAILIAASGDIYLNGTIRADGGLGFTSTASSGGRGSGGAIRLIANRIIGNGILSAAPNGRIKTQQFDVDTSLIPPAQLPLVTYNPTNNPIIKITRVAGNVVVQPPTGNPDTPDVFFSQTGPVAIDIETTRMPTNTVLNVRITSDSAVINATTPPTDALGKTTLTHVVPAGKGTIQATATYTTP